MPRILVIEDDDQVRTMLCMTLGQAGYDTVEASNGKVGMRVQRETPADLIVTDIIMPDQEGLETIMKLRKECPAVPIIAISGGGRVAARDCLNDARLLGAKKTFQKPVDRGELLGTVRGLLDEKAA